jgi:hypothetical protein
MPIERRVTSLLEKAKVGDQDAADDIVRHFWEAARRAARRHLTSCARKFEGESDIANAALRSALSELSKPKTVFRSRDDFEGLIVDIVRKKSTSAMRHALAAKRREPVDAELELLFQAKRRKEARETPVNLAMADELGERVVDFLKQESNPVKQSVGILGIVEQLGTEDILQSFRSTGATPPATRTVQKYVEHTRRSLADALRDDYGELLPPKKQSAEEPNDHGQRAAQKSGKKATQKKSSPSRSKGRKKNSKR